MKETSWRIFRPKPGLDHLRRQARDLLRATRTGDTTAAGDQRTTGPHAAGHPGWICESWA